MTDVVLYAVLLAFAASVLYTIIGLIPGTDETASLVPPTLLLVLLGVPEPALLAWFIAAICAMETANTIPAALASIPGSTMAVPFIPSCTVMRRLGIPHIAIQKLLAGSVLGTVVAVPIALFVGGALTPFGDIAKANAPYIYIGGCILLAVFTKSRFAALLAIVPFALLLQGTQRIAVETVGKPLTVSIFMGIALGPMIIDQLLLLTPHGRVSLRRNGPQIVALALPKQSGTVHFNPLRYLTRQQVVLVLVFSGLSATTFVLSPVGMTVLLGGVAMLFGRSLYQRHTNSLAVMDGVTNSTYIAETLIPLIAFGLPLSPMALGPASPLFNAPPRFTVEPVNNLHNLLTHSEFVIFSLIGAVIGLAFAYALCLKYSHAACRFVFTKIGHESLIGCFAGLAVLLAYHEARAIGVLLALLIAIVGGALYRLLQINLGVQFMIFYASTGLLQILKSF